MSGNNKNIKLHDHFRKQDIYIIKHSTKCSNIVQVVVLKEPCELAGEFQRRFSIFIKLILRLIFALYVILSFFTTFNCSIM